MKSINNTSTALGIWRNAHVNYTVKNVTAANQTKEGLLSKLNAINNSTGDLDPGLTKKQQYPTNLKPRRYRPLW